MARTKSSQTKHDKTVKKVAKEYEQKGFDVEADIKGYSKPGTIGGLRPDVVATKGKERKIIEVETPDSLDSSRDLKQKETFRKASKRSKNTAFRRIVTD